MTAMNSKSVRFLLWPLLVIRRRVIARLNARRRLDVFRYDRERFLNYSGVTHCDNREALLARLIMTYHVVEKGLTMPRRRYDFGHSVIRDLMKYVREFETVYGREEQQVSHAVCLIKDYLGMHQRIDFDFSIDQEYWGEIIRFCDAHPDVSVVPQPHVTRDKFFADINAPFPVFAASRHTVRHYAGEVDVKQIETAVRLAMTAPSACNRQHVRVHCISDHGMRDAVFNIQHGNRGFGSDADKLLCVTFDLADLRGWEERNDGYVNAGIFIMNLCYALHSQRIGNCILNWHARRDEDLEMRKILGIPPRETIVAFIACGGVPAEFDIAASPRRDFREIFSEHR